MVIQNQTGDALRMISLRQVNYKCLSVDFDISDLCKSTGGVYLRRCLMDDVVNLAKKLSEFHQGPHQATCFCLLFEVFLRPGLVIEALVSNWNDGRLISVSYHFILTAPFTKVDGAFEFALWFSKG